MRPQDTSVWGRQRLLLALEVHMKLTCTSIFVWSGLDLVITL
jgi:hypothetical protein